MKVLKGETGIGIGSHIGKVLSYESFPEHGQCDAFHIVMRHFFFELLGI